MNKKPAVVILDPDPETRAEVHRTLSLTNISVLASGGLGVEGHTLVAEARPDLVLLALEPPIERGLQTLEGVRASFPLVPVIVYSTVEDGPAVRRAMIAGASDYLPAPINGRTAAEAITTTIERFQPMSRPVHTENAGQPAGAGMIITVFGAKGGIGKTTLSTNLATALVRESGASVVIVDIDTRFGDVAIMLDTPVDRSIADAARDIDKLDRGSIRRYLMQHESGLLVLPAPIEPSDWDQVEPSHIERIVHLLAQTHDYVILDTPGAFNENVAMALDLATVLLLVTSLEMASIKDTSMVLNMLRSWSFPEEKVRLTVNHSNMANSVKDTDIARTLDYRVFWSVPYDDSVSKSTQVGRPVVLLRPNSKVAANIASLAALLGGTAGRQPREAKKGLLQRLLSKRS